MGALEDYYKKQQQLILAAAQQNEINNGRDPARVGQPAAAPAPSPVSVAAGAPTPDASSYVPQSNGGVDPGRTNVAERVFGQDQTKVTAATQAALPDRGDAALVAAANSEYERLTAEWKARQVELTKQMSDAFDHQDFAKLIKLQTELMKTAASPPGKPDLLAIQHMSDRDRLLTTIGGTYEPLIAQLSDAASGRGPSAALNTYRAAADDASSRNYGIAASAKGTGGQRAALFQAALGQNAQDAQGAARQSAIIAAQEQNQARGALNSSLQGLTNVYGTTNLLGDTSHQQDKNQDAYNEAIGINAKIQEGNAARASEHLDKGLEAGGKLAGGI